LFLFLLPLCIALGQSVAGETEFFSWHTPEGLLPRVTPLVALADRDYQEAIAWLELPPQAKKGHLEWVPRREDLARAMGRASVPDWYAAVTLPAQSRILFAVNEAAGQAQLRNTLRHEMAHYAMSGLGYETYTRIPAWFHEGVAQFFAEDILLKRVGVSISWLSFTGDLAPLSKYRKSFGAEAAGAAEGYALGYRLVSRLIRRYGRDFPARVLRAMGQGATIDEALINLTSLSVVTHEADLRKELSSFHSMLGDSEPRIFLWMALGLLVGYPFVRRARRKKRLEMEAKWYSEEECARKAEAAIEELASEVTFREDKPSSSH